MLKQGCMSGVQRVAGTLGLGGTCACMRRKWQAVDTRPQPGLKYLRMADRLGSGLWPCSAQATLARSSPALLRSPGLLWARPCDQDANKTLQMSRAANGVRCGGRA